MAKKMKGDYTQKEFNSILDVLVKMVKVYSSEKYHINIGTGYRRTFNVAIHKWGDDDKIADSILFGITPWYEDKKEELIAYLKGCFTNKTDSDEFYKGLKHIVELKDVA